MASKADLEVRKRLAAWTRYLMGKYSLSQRALAKKIGVKQPTISRALSGKGTLGLDYLVKLHRGFAKSADLFLDSYPPGAADNPHGASPEAGAPPERQKKQGAHRLAAPVLSAT